MKVYTFVNSAVFKGGNVVPMYRVFDAETRQVTWEVFVYGRSMRGRISIVDSFVTDSRSKAAAWRKSRGSR